MQAHDLNLRPSLPGLESDPQETPHPQRNQRPRMSVEPNRTLNSTSGIFRVPRRALGAALFFTAWCLMQVLLPNPGVNFLSVNLHVLWRLDSDTNLISFHAEN